MYPVMIKGFSIFFYVLISAYGYIIICFKLCKLHNLNYIILTSRKRTVTTQFTFFEDFSLLKHTLDYAIGFNCLRSRFHFSTKQASLTIEAAFIFWLRRDNLWFKQSLWSLRLWVIFRLSNVENLELINKITIFAHENGTQRKLGKRI